MGVTVYRTGSADTVYALKASAPALMPRRYLEGIAEEP